MCSVCGATKVRCLECGVVSEDRIEDGNFRFECPNCGEEIGIECVLEKAHK